MNDSSATLERPATESFFDRARARLNLDVPASLSDPNALGARGDLDLNPESWIKAGVKATRPAAVLVPVIDRNEPTVLLTQRTPDLTTHAGQIAFPGGRIERDDASPVAAALRETREETGLGAILI
ncbi:MAG: CoA pyrophosphatase, partial [Xanthobacteraceae bacterium]